MSSLTHSVRVLPFILSSQLALNMLISFRSLKKKNESEPDRKTESRRSRRIIFSNQDQGSKARYHGAVDEDRRPRWRLVAADEVFSLPPAGAAPFLIIGERAGTR